MNKLMIFIFIILNCVLLSGCTHKSCLEKYPVEFFICIDGIEYIKYSAGYAGYMAPHLRADAQDYPLVVRCSQ